jgi:hypothetical protein
MDSSKEVEKTTTTVEETSTTDNLPTTKLPVDGASKGQVQDAVDSSTKQVGAAVENAGHAISDAADKPATK